MPDHEYNGCVFHWAEAKWGGSRGISIHVKKVQGSNRDFKFDPDPHQNPAYNKNQAKFYTTAVDTAVRAYDPQSRSWSVPAPFDWKGTTYRFEPR